MASSGLMRACSRRSRSCRRVASDAQRAAADRRVVRDDQQRDAAAVQLLDDPHDLAHRTSSRGCRSARRRAEARLHDDRAAIATRWRSPPESWSGRWSEPRSEPDRLEHRRWRARAARAARRRASTSGSSTFSSAVSRGTRWKNWNTKPMCCWRFAASASSSSFATSSPCSGKYPTSAGRAGRAR